MPVRPQKQQASRSKVTGFDLNRAQDNISRSIGDLQAKSLQIVDNEPKSSSSPGTRGQIWFGAKTGELKVCVGLNSWVRYVGTSF